MKGDFVVIREIYDSMNDTHSFKLLKAFCDPVDEIFDRFNANYRECFKLIYNDIDEIIDNQSIDPKNYTDYHISSMICDTNESGTWYVEFVDNKNLITYKYRLIFDSVF